MVDVTWPGGQKIQVKAETVIRIRRARPLIDGPNGKSQVYWLQRDLFEEEAAWIASAVSAELAVKPKPDLPALGQVSSPDNSPIWFSGAVAMGPMYVVPANRGNGANSSLMINNMRQVVTNTPEEVAEIVRKSGGQVMPIRRDITAGTASLEAIRRLLNENRVWDADLLIGLIPPPPTM
jgi:hypothetical protein